MARRLAGLLALALLRAVLPAAAASNATGRASCSARSACDEDEADASVEAANLVQSSYSLAGISAAVRSLAVRAAVAAGAGRASPRGTAPPMPRAADSSFLGTASLASSGSGGAGSSFLMIPLGMLLVALSVPVLWANERKAAMYESLVQVAAGDVEEIRPNDPVVVDNRGRLVHVEGAPAKGQAPVQDRRVPECRMEDGALRLRSTVEQYQEHEVQAQQARQSGVGPAGSGHGGSSHGGSGRGGASRGGSSHGHGGSHGILNIRGGGPSRGGPSRGGTGHGGSSHGASRGGASHGVSRQTPAAQPQRVQPRVQSAPRPQTQTVRKWSALPLGGSKSGPNDKLLQGAPSSLQLGVQSVTCPTIAVGSALLLPPDLAAQFDSWQNAAGKIGTVVGGFKLQPSDHYYYVASADPSSPQVGDQRIKFEYIPDTKVSVLGLQCDLVDANRAVRRVRPARPKGRPSAGDEPEPEAESDDAPMEGAAVKAGRGRDADALLPWRLVPRGVGCCAVSEEELKRRLIAAGQRDPQEVLDDQKCACGLLESCCCVSCCVSVCNLVDAMQSVFIFPQVYGICMGSVSADKMLQPIKQMAGMQTWFFRFLGWFLMMAGFMMIFSPISSLLDLIPLVGSFLSSAVTLVVGIVALVLTLTISTLIVALAYLLYRPLVGVAYLLLTGAIVAGTIYIQGLLASS